MITEMDGNGKIRLTKKMQWSNLLKMIILLFVITFPINSTLTDWDFALDTRY